MSLKYHIKRRDVLFCRLCYILHNKALLTISLVAIGLMTLSISAGGDIQDRGVGFRVFLVVFGFVFATSFYIAIQLTINLIMLTSNKSRGLVGDHTAEIKDEGLEESTSVNRLLHRWNPAFRVMDFAGYAWIFPGDGHFYYIPKRLDGYEGDLAGFFEQLKRRAKGN